MTVSFVFTASFIYVASISQSQYIHILHDNLRQNTGNNWSVSNSNAVTFGESSNNCPSTNTCTKLTAENTDDYIWKSFPNMDIYSTITLQIDMSVVDVTWQDQERCIAKYVYGGTGDIIGDYTTLVTGNVNGVYFNNTRNLTAPTDPTLWIGFGIHGNSGGDKCYFENLYLWGILKTASPTLSPTTFPTLSPTVSSQFPTHSPTTISPTLSPTTFPTLSPTTISPTTAVPTSPFPSQFPTRFPTHFPTQFPTLVPAAQPTKSPSFGGESEQSETTSNGENGNTVSDNFESNENEGFDMFILMVIIGLVLVTVVIIAMVYWYHKRGKRVKEDKMTIIEMGTGNMNTNGNTNTAMTTTLSISAVYSASSDNDVIQTNDKNTQSLNCGEGSDDDMYDAPMNQNHITPQTPKNPKIDNGESDDDLMHIKGNTTKGKRENSAEEMYTYENQTKQ
eukprot:300322_1